MKYQEKGLYEVTRRRCVLWNKEKEFMKEQGEKVVGGTRRRSL